MKWQAASAWRGGVEENGGLKNSMWYRKAAWRGENIRSVKKYRVKEESMWRNKTCWVKHQLMSLSEMWAAGVKAVANGYNRQAKKWNIMKRKYENIEEAVKLEEENSGEASMKRSSWRENHSIETLVWEKKPIQSIKSESRNERRN